jgi:predicted peroxiredoxin
MIATSGIYNLTGYDARFKITKSFSLGAGTYNFVGKDATLVYTNNGTVIVTKGGISKSKVYKNSRKEVEDDIAKAIAKVTGEDEELALVPESADNNLETEIRAAEEVRLQEMVMQAQALALQTEIDRLIQDELDDEESLMLLL